MDAAFEKFNEQMEAETAVCEAIRTQTRELSKISRTITYGRERLRHYLDAQAHAIVDPAAAAATEAPTADAAAAASAAASFTANSPFASQPAFLAHGLSILSKCAELEPLWAALEAAIVSAASATASAGAAAGATASAAPTVEKYRDMWRFALNDILASVAVVYYLVYGKLISLDTMADVVKVPESIGVPLEDYLLAVAGLPQEVTPYATLAVRVNLFTVPAQLSAFVGDLYSGFRLLNLKNDALRRRFDGIKYAVTKLDEIVYDLHIRKLNVAPAAAPADAAAANAAANGSE